MAQAKPVQIFLAGDVMLGRFVCDAFTLDPTWKTDVWGEYLDYLERAPCPTIVAGNLECAVTAGEEEEVPKAYNFRLKPKNADCLKLFNFDVLFGANNHILDYGPKGLEKTWSSLSELGVNFIGAGPNLAAACAPVIISKGGLRVAFFAASDQYEWWAADEGKPGINYIDPSSIPAAQPPAQPSGDVVGLSPSSNTGSSSTRMAVGAQGVTSAALGTVAPGKGTFLTATASAASTQPGSGLKTPEGNKAVEGASSTSRVQEPLGKQQGAGGGQAGCASGQWPPAWFAQLKACKEGPRGAHLVVVSMHWGPNWRWQPHRELRQLARALADAGADIIFGHGAHHVQGVEVLDGRVPVIYGAGKFVDDFKIDNEFRNDVGCPWVVHMEGGRVVSLTGLPCHIKQEWRQGPPKPLPPGEGCPPYFTKVTRAEGLEFSFAARKIKQLSADLGTQVTVDDQARTIRIEMLGPSEPGPGASATSFLV